MSSTNFTGRVCALVAQFAGSQVDICVVLLSLLSNSSRSVRIFNFACSLLSWSL